jgi:hypothetical protein
MSLSRNGKIILIEDEEDEALAIVKSLGKVGYPLSWYTGQVSELPDNPVGGIRFVFLDVTLQGMESSPDKTKASQLAGILTRLISTENGPFVIIFWTKHQDLIELVLQHCTKESISPLAHIDLEKLECRNKDREYDIKIINDKLNDKLQAISAFGLYVEWENLLHEASHEFMSEFTGLAPYGDDWSGNTIAIFHSLYKAYVDENDLEDEGEKFKCASILLNRSFLDTLHQKSLSSLNLPNGIVLNGSIDESTKSKLNRYLFIGNPIVQRPSSGYIYNHNNDSLKESLTKSIFLPQQTVDGSELCMVIITPECDLAHKNKVLCQLIDQREFKFHRIIYGLLFNYPDDFDRRYRKSDAKFRVGPFWMNDQAMFIVFHFGSLSYLAESDILGDAILSLSRDLTFDLQSQASNHVNRLGNFQLGQ